MVEILNTSVDKAIFPFFVITNLNLSNYKYKLVYLDHYYHRNSFQRLYETGIPIL